MSATPLIFALPGNEDLARQLAQASGWACGQWLVRRFPDGESHLRFLEEIAGRDLVFVCSLDAPDQKVMQLYLAARIARELECGKIGLVLPYLAYMRQDARFNPGEGITSAHFAGLISSICDWMLTVDPHLHRHHALSDIYSVPAKVVPAAPEIAKWIQAHVQSPVLLGPDEESAQWVQAVAELAQCPHTVLRKQRHGDRQVEVSVPDTARWQGMTPVLIDDIASTGKTMLAAAAHLQQAGMAAPVCIAVHALFAEDAYQQLSAAKVARVVSCDTVLHESNQIHMAPALAAAMLDMVAQ